MDKGDGSEQQPRNGRYRSGQAPGNAVEPLHGNPHVIGRQLVLRGGLHGNAELAVAKQRVEQYTQHACCTNHHHLLHVKDQTAHIPDLVFVGHGQGVGVGADVGDHGDQPACHVANADGQHDDGECRLAQNRADHDPLQRHAKQRHGPDGARHR